MKHFANESKKPFGELTDKEQACLARACFDDKIQYWNVDEWLYCDSFYSSQKIYRTKPNLLEVQIPWDLIDDQYVAFAIDENKLAWFYVARPIILDGCLSWYTPVKAVQSPLKLDLDGINWKESLVMRPGHE